MEIFILGVILGMGLMLLVRITAQELQRNAKRRAAAFREAVNNEVARRLDTPAEGWTTEDPWDMTGRKFQPIRHP